MGRPTKYKKEYCKQFIEYFDIELNKVITKKLITKKGDVIEIEQEVARDFPSLAGFSVKIGVHRDTLHEWANAKDENEKLKHPEFSDVYKRAKDFQENYLLVNGNKGLISAPMGIFSLKNICGFRDKQPGEEDKTITHREGPKVEKAELEDRMKKYEGEK